MTADVCEVGGGREMAAETLKRQVAGYAAGMAIQMKVNCLVMIEMCILRTKGWVEKRSQMD